MKIWHLFSKVVYEARLRVILKSREGRKNKNPTGESVVAFKYSTSHKCISLIWPNMIYSMNPAIELTYYNCVYLAMVK